MPRDFRLYLEDIVEAIGRIQRYTAGQSFPQFSEDEKTVDAVVRNLEVIGEAVKRIPEEMRQKHLSMEWKRLPDYGIFLFTNTSASTRRSSGTSFRISCRFSNGRSDTCSDIEGLRCRLPRRSRIFSISKKGKRTA